MTHSSTFAQPSTSHAARVRRASVITGIYLDDYLYFTLRERFGGTCNRPCVLSGESDRTRLPAGRITLRGFSFPSQLRAGTGCVDTGGVAHSSAKRISGGRMHEVPGVGRWP